MLLAGVSMAALAGVAIYWVAGIGIVRFYLIGAVILSWKLLLEPAREVYRNPSPQWRLLCSTKASYMPAGFLVVALLSMILPI